jgi:hypothetical protein
VSSVNVPEGSESCCPVVQGVPVVNVSGIVPRVKPGIEQDKDVGSSGPGMTGELVRPVSTPPIGWRERIEVHTYSEREVSDRVRQVEGSETGTY